MCVSVVKAGSSSERWCLTWWSLWGRFKGAIVEFIFTQGHRLVQPLCLSLYFQFYFFFFFYCSYISPSATLQHHLLDPPYSIRDVGVHFIFYTVFTVVFFHSWSRSQRRHQCRRAALTSVITDLEKSDFSFGTLTINFCVPFVQSGSTCGTTFEWRMETNQKKMLNLPYRYWSMKEENVESSTERQVFS